jgi:hypothetical protein
MRWSLTEEERAWIVAAAANEARLAETPPAGSFPCWPTIVKTGSRRSRSGS